MPASRTQNISAEPNLGPGRCDGAYMTGGALKGIQREVEGEHVYTRLAQDSQVTLVGEALDERQYHLNGEVEQPRDPQGLNAGIGADEMSI